MIIAFGVPLIGTLVTVLGMWKILKQCPYR